MIALRHLAAPADWCRQITGWGTGRPLPQARCRSYPHAAVDILVQRRHYGAETSVIAITGGAFAADCAEGSRRPRETAHPHGSGAILQQRENSAARKRRIFSQLTVLPTHQPIEGADPEGPVACRQEGSHRGARKLLPWRKRQRHRPNTVESNDTALRSEPEITVRRLRDCVDRALHEPIAIGPCGMCVLTYIQRRIQRKSMRTPEQHVERAKRNECSHGRYLSFRPLHMRFGPLPGSILSPGAPKHARREPVRAADLRSLLQRRGPVKDHIVSFQKALPRLKHQKLEPISSNCILIDCWIWNQSRIE